MITISTGRKALSALVVAAVVGVALSPAAAFAKGGHGHGGGHYGYGAAALFGGLVVGAIAADAYEDAPACWTEKQVSYGAYGERFVQKVRVCE